MKKSKLIILSLLAVAVMATATACGGKKNEISKPPVTTSAETAASTANEETEAVEENDADDTIISSDSKESGQMTGTLEENKGFMFLIISDEDKESYAFSIDDESALAGFKEGDKITVSYEGGDPADHDTDCIVTNIEKAK
ncbi:hypothetical protein [Clostridium transplantifaecale]|uniref:hypothetical protein n=1 Tax=Clostridium transplantifaecale TaxID=2479838 RepID=UPI000F63C39E|nr:hypothetical protein [Clostridium transplantifaecale]